MRRNPVVIAAVLLLVAALPAWAQAVGARSAKGRVVDEEGNGVRGVKILFWATSNPTLKWDATTNKKGRFFIDGLYTAQEGDSWRVALEGDELAPYEVSIETRTSSGTLVGDPSTSKVKPGAAIRPMRIPPFGVAEVDLKVAPPQRVAELTGVPPEVQPGSAGSGRARRPLVRGTDHGAGR
jgi:hypothetical protein